MRVLEARTVFVNKSDEQALDCEIKTAVHLFRILPNWSAQANQVSFDLAIDVELYAMTVLDKHLFGVGDNNNGASSENGLTSSHISVHSGSLHSPQVDSPPFVK